LIWAGCGDAIVRGDVLILRRVHSERAVVRQAAD
jgi:hypothetical protein